MIRTTEQNVSPKKHADVRGSAVLYLATLEQLKILNIHMYQR